MKNLLLLFFVIGMIGATSAQEVYYTESFDDGLPAEWLADGDGWLYGAGADVGSAYFGVPDTGSGVVCFNDDALGNGAVGGGRISSGAIDLTAAAGDVFFQMNYFFPNLDYQGADETVTLFVSTDMGASFSEYQSFDGDGGNWTVGFVDMSEFAGTSIMIALEYLDGDTWNYGWAIDGIEIADRITLIPARSYGINAGSSTVMDEAKAGVDYKVSGFVFNRGLETIESFDVVMTDGTNEVRESVTGMNIEFNGVARYSLSESIVVPDGNSTWTVTMENVNGNADADEDTSNNSSSFNLNGMSSIHPDKGVMVEEATGTWCTWCPRGTVFLDEMSKRFGSSFVGVAVHNSDPMVLAAYDNAITSFAGFQGFPSVIYNRESVIDPDAIVSPSILDMVSAPTAGITVGGEYDAATGDFVSSVEVNFLQDATVDYNVSVILTEDGLSGTSADWAQVNAYSGGGQGPMGGFEALPSPAPAELMVYDHVGVGLIGDYEGVANVVTGDYASGDVKSYRFDAYNISSAMLTENMHVIGVITDRASGEVVNVASVSFEDALANGLSTSIADNFDNTYADVNPSLVVDQTTIFMSLEDSRNVKAYLVNSIGQRVATQNYGQQLGQVQLQFDMTNVNAGMYYLHIQADDKLITKKLTKAE